MLDYNYDVELSNGSYFTDKHVTREQQTEIESNSF
jgi:hypothetical protein